MSAAALMLLPDSVIEQQRRELESEEQRPLFSPGSHPAAEKEESSHYTAPAEKQGLLYPAWRLFTRAAAA